MAAVTICSGFEPKKIKSVTASISFFIIWLIICLFKMNSFEKDSSAIKKLKLLTLQVGTNFWSVIMSYVTDIISQTRKQTSHHPESHFSRLSFWGWCNDCSNESVLHIRWPKYWSFSIRPSNEYSGLNSFKMDWLDLLAIQGTLKSLFQHHDLKASILQHSAFFMVHLWLLGKP